MKPKTTNLDKRFNEVGCVFYDADCPLCVGLARRFAGMLARREFAMAPLQSPEAFRRLGLLPGEPLTEMRLALNNGQTLGGAEALVELARHYWWAWPVALLARFQTGRVILSGIYRWIADRRACRDGKCAIARKRQSSKRPLAGRGGWMGIMPFLILPFGAYLVFHDRAAWVLMWGLAVALGYSLKWLTWLDAHRGNEVNGSGRTAAYFLAWPGMDAPAFLDPARAVNTPGAREFAVATAKTLAGAILVWGVARLPLPMHPNLAGWLGMIGTILCLHFGAFHLLSCFWRSRHVDAQPIMNAPLASQSLAEFWSRRWNLAFSGPAQRFLMIPIARKYGTLAALMIVFLVSGLVHDLVISVPARGGYGLPTLYFVLQGAAMCLERSHTGRKWGLGRGWRGRIYTLAITGLPVYWLFHPLFIQRVFLPFLAAIHAI